MRATMCLNMCMYFCVNRCLYVCMCVSMCIVYLGVYILYAYMCMFGDPRACLCVYPIERLCILAVFTSVLSCFCSHREESTFEKKTILCSLKGKAQKYPNQAYDGDCAAITNRFNGLCGMPDCVLDKRGD